MAGFQRKHPEVTLMMNTTADINSINLMVSRWRTLKMQSSKVTLGTKHLSYAEVPMAAQILLFKPGTGEARIAHPGHW
ncbi:MAG: hypothetical protein ACI8P9_003838 [Parasphingorhabdus sp.]|jgi:hypothetical protein